MNMVDWKPFEEIEHTADLALVARGRDLRELILNASRGVIHLIADTAAARADEWAAIRSSGTEPERILLGFIREILLEWEQRGGIPVAVEVPHAPGSAWLADPSSPGEARGRLGLAHPPDAEERIRAVPKAVTYHSLQIRRVGELLETSLVLDL